MRCATQPNGRLAAKPRTKAGNEAGGHAKRKENTRTAGHVTPQLAPHATSGGKGSRYWDGTAGRKSRLWKVDRSTRIALPESWRPRKGNFPGGRRHGRSLPCHRDATAPPSHDQVSAARFSERFEWEARVIASLNHPHICQLHDVGPNFLVMELVEGPTLADRTKTRRWSSSARSPRRWKQRMKRAGCIAI